MTEERWSDTDLLSHIVDFISEYSIRSENPFSLLPGSVRKLELKASIVVTEKNLTEAHLLTPRLTAVLPDALSQFTPSLIHGNCSMTIKKRHEVGNLTVLLLDYCKYYGINRIVDVGCGVGHLVSQLSRHCKVVGIDCNEDFCQRARKSCAYAEIICLTITCDGAEDQNLSKFLSGDEYDRTAVVSLHGCGDLQPALLRYFCKLDRNRVPLIFTIPCCYHKMLNLEKEVFHWIMSDEIKRRSISCEVLPVSALRLACQKHIYNWPSSDREREKHTNNFINRALLECLYDKRKDLPPFTCRKLNCNFGDLRGTGAKLASQLGMDENGVSQIDQLYRAIYTEQESYFAYIEPFTLLQTMMQIPLEFFILLDRLFFLREHGCSAHLLSIFNPKVSSRHLCLIGSR
uniref:Methyltransferase domain-containing protein n=1 Tax=Setaria digitata TaxID=48799 RepID=A0A915PJP9_9BILA